MKNRSPIHVLLAALLLWTVPFPTPAADDVPVTSGPPSPPGTSGLRANVTNRFEIRDMHCAGCAGGIKAELKQTPGVVSAEVSFPKRLAVVAYDTNRVSQPALVKVVGDAGYEAVVLSGGKGRRR